MISIITTTRIDYRYNYIIMNRADVLLIMNAANIDNAIGIRSTIGIVDINR